VGFIHKLFMTHPPIGERIAALRRVNIEHPEA
jgi:Zn-dependent protease with chaperone function